MSQLSYPLASAQPLNGWQLMTALINGEKAPSNARKTSFRLKFLGRSLLNWRTTSGLLSTRQQPAAGGDPERTAEPAVQTASPVSGGQHEQDRMPVRPARSLRSHRAAHAAEDAPRPPRPAVFRAGQSDGQNEAPIALELAAIDKLNKEGEATLLLRNANGVMLAEITFALMHYQQQPTLFIGGLQGANHEVPHAEIQHTTKECHGLFPKRLVLEGICTLARHLGIRQIVAVGNATHIYQNWRYQSKKKDKLHADYDQFWLSMGAKPLDSGYFLLPERIARKPIEEIASKKRAEYRRRYQLLDELEQGLAAHFCAR